MADLKRGLILNPGAVKFALKTYIDRSAFPAVPAVFGHYDLVPANGWGMLANDRLSNCVLAGRAHETMMLTAEGGNAAVFSDASVIADYAAVTGYDPKIPGSDAGTDMLSAAEYSRTIGILDASGKRHKIAAYLSLDPTDLTDLFIADYLFNAIGIGLNLPSSAETQFDLNQVWRVMPGATNIGGHYVPFLGRRADQGLMIVTWGATVPATRAFFDRYAEEAVVYVSTEAMVNQKSPEGFDYNQLIADLKNLASKGNTPVIT
jgi:hypothetical protein